MHSGAVDFPEKRYMSSARGTVLGPGWIVEGSESCMRGAKGPSYGGVRVVTASRIHKAYDREESRSGLQVREAAAREAELVVADSQPGSSQAAGEKEKPGTQEIQAPRHPGTQAPGHPVAMQAACQPAKPPCLQVYLLTHRHTYIRTSTPAILTYLHAYVPETQIPAFGRACRPARLRRCRDRRAGVRHRVSAMCVELHV